VDPMAWKQYTVMSQITIKKASGGARLKDIAEHVGVSRSEVSRVLNGRTRVGKDIGQDLRQRILDTARGMNYRPNRAAQSLARGRTDTVALMMVITPEEAESPHSPQTHQELSAHYQEIVGALTYTLHEYGMNLLLAQCGGKDKDPLDALEEFARSQTCDGIIITDLRIDDHRLEILDDVGLPYVIRGSSPRPGVIAVGADNFQVGYQAITYLHSLGHRRIAFFNVGRDLMSGQGRYSGFQTACQQLGLSESVEYRDDVHYGDGLYNAVRLRLQEPLPPTAIFAEDEIGALGVLRALEEAGLRVPQDMSVMTCLNARFMRQVAPQLTVLNVHQAEVASTAGHLMAQMLRGDTVDPGQRFIAPTLEVHESTARYPFVNSYSMIGK
jgi:DNA-binding LacI/PurR family transcriptional regulator